MHIRFQTETFRLFPQLAGHILWRWVFLFICLPLFLVMMPVSASAQGGTLELGNLILDNQAGNITVRFGVRVDGLEALEHVLGEGSTVALVCKGGVYQRKSLWLDKEIAEIRWQSTLHRDVLARDYVLDLPGSDKPLRSKNLGELLHDGWERLAMVVGPWSDLTSGAEYSLDLNFSLARTDVPTWLRYIVFFKSWDVYPPVSYQLDFSY